MKLSLFKPNSLFLAVVASILLLSCTAEDERDTFGFMTADIDNATFTSRTGNNYVNAEKNFSSNTTLTIQGSTEDGKDIILKVIDYEGAGNYSINFSGDPQGSEGLLLDVNRRYSTNIAAGGTGSVTITADNDSEISGTFQFIALNRRDLTITRTISNGKFLARIRK